VIIHRKNCAN